MAENRSARDLESRELAKRKNMWAPSQLLPSPKTQPGWTFRWIRTSILGQLDPTNASAKFREGWVPVKAEDHPEIMLIADPTSRFPGSIEIGGLVLCKAPTEMVDARKEWFNSQTQAQVEAVDNNFMRTNDARMPLFSETRSGITFGRGNK